MGREDWYRQTTWSDEIEKEFFTRLGRSRQNSSKVQYLRIQALYLQDAHPGVANRLLDAMLAMPTERTEIASAYLQKAEIAIRLGRAHDEIIPLFRKSIQQQRDFSKVRTTVHRRFGRYVVDGCHPELYDEALSVLSEFADVDMFPSDRYEANGIRAIISDQKGDSEAARLLATSALQQAARTESGLRYHKTIGIVKDRSSGFDRRIEEIARRQQ